MSICRYLPSATLWVAFLVFVLVHWSDRSALVLLIAALLLLSALLVSLSFDPRRR